MKGPIKVSPKADRFRAFDPKAIGLSAPAALLFALFLGGRAFADDPRGDYPNAPAHSPEEERALFHLPRGFEIQLVAAEPEIQKPINLNFDSQGRLWVTGSEQYPWPSSVDASGNAIPGFEKTYREIANAFAGGKEPPPISAEPKDSIRILSQFDKTGRAQKIELFADRLNIPSGIQPLVRKGGQKGDTAIVYSIPYIWRLEDTDGDGKADKREILYGPFGFLDTHGGCSSYIQWIDGWIYATLGFRNRSEVSDRKGNVTVFDSGNTIRFQPDGSRIEYYTHGQTNPFGLAFDPFGNLFSADSHSKPVYLLLPGGYYEGIGKQHDGLGFAPKITDDDHGSSAIGGMVCYSDDKWPEEFRGNTFNGNVVTRRINRDKLEWHGSTPAAVRQPDFLTCDDQWFRPVNIKMGPDGALWIADFYNPIIGHYEVPLTHPNRDHTHGRIWRVVYAGERRGDTADGTIADRAPPDISTLDARALCERLRDPNLEARRLATNELVDRLGKAGAPTLETFLEGHPLSTIGDLSGDDQAERAVLRKQTACIISAYERLRQDLGSKGGADNVAAAGYETFVAPHSAEVAAAQLRMMASEAKKYGRWHLDDFESILRDESSLPMERRFAAEAISTAVQELAAPNSADATGRLAQIIDSPSDIPGERLRDAERTIREAKRRAVEEVPACLNLLLKSWDLTPPKDTELLHSLLMAIRDCLLIPGCYAKAETIAKTDPQAAEHLASASLGSSTPESAEFLLNYLDRTKLESPRTGEFIKYLAVHIRPDLAPMILTLAQMYPGAPMEKRLAIASALAQASRIRGAALSEDESNWIRSVTTEALKGTDESAVKLAIESVREAIDSSKLDPLSRIISDRQRPSAIRTAALDAVANLEGGRPAIERAIMDSSSLTLRKRAAELLGQSHSPTTVPSLTTALVTAPADLAISIGSSLAKSDAGADALMSAIEAGKASPALLRNNAIAGPLKAREPALQERAKLLSKDLPPEDARLDKVIAERAAGYRAAHPDSAHGEKVFLQNCAACHRIKGAGGNIGPNLDGIASRGVARLVEDVLDPSRNVDPAFRQIVIETTDGRTLAGVGLRENGELLTMNDASGMEVSVSREQVKTQTSSRLSLMPPNFEQVLSTDDLYDLVSFLLSRSAIEP